MHTAAEDCIALFDTDTGGRLAPNWEKGVLYQRTHTIRAGNMVEVICFPIWDRSTASSMRKEADKEKHRAAQARTDEKNAKRRLARLVNANFDAEDMFATCEYPPNAQPTDEKQAQRGMQNFLRRVKDWRKKNGLQPPKYIYVTERTESAVHGVRYHHHVILSGDGMDRETLESLWTKKRGGYCNSRRIQPQGMNLTGLCCYLLKDKKGRTMAKDGKNPQTHIGRRWNASKNLIQPTINTADKKISIRKAGRIAVAVQEEAASIFQRLYPDCVLMEYEVKRSPWAAGLYIYAVLRQRTPDSLKKRGQIKKPSGGGASRRASPPAQQTGNIHEQHDYNVFDIRMQVPIAKKSLG